MPLPAIIGAIGAGMSGAGGLVGSVIDYYQGNRQYEYQKKVDEKNYELQKEQFGLEKENLEYQRNLQNTIFSREDSAVQRRVADLKAAGMSPILAAGQGASAGAVVKTDTPQAPQKEYHPNEARLLPVMLQLLEINRMKADITKTQQENQLIDFQKRKADADILAALTAARKNASASAIDEWDLQKYKETNRASTAGTIGKNMGDVMNLFNSNPSESLIDKINDKFKKLEEWETEQIRKLKGGK